jgi:hypothetical protein
MNKTCPGATGIFEYIYLFISGTIRMDKFFESCIRQVTKAHTRAFMQNADKKNYRGK